MITFLYVIVLYKRPLSDSPAFNSIISARPAGKLFVYDNSPVSQTDLTQYSTDRIYYNHDSDNEGISKAYIAAAEYAKAHGVTHMVFFDQDTCATLEFFETLEKQIVNHPDIAIFAPILRCKDVTVSPCKVILYKGIEDKDPRVGVQSLSGVSLINSALCVSTEAYFVSGGYNRAIRLDFSDIYFIDQLRKVYNQYCLLPITLEHSLSTFVDSKESVISRFRFYCDGAREYLTPKNFIFVSLYAMIRMMKLCAKYKTVIFVKIFFRYFITKGRL